MEQLGLSQEEIAKFVEPEHWIEHFPLRANDAIQRFGLHTDIDRAFITTSKNPYYDSFIRWQFNTLKSRGYLKFGKR
jgi:leucyl-tRNA synthetase